MLKQKYLKQKHSKKELKEFLAMAEEEIRQWEAFIKEVKEKLLDK